METKRQTKQVEVLSFDLNASDIHQALVDYVQKHNPAVRHFSDGDFRIHYTAEKKTGQTPALYTARISVEREPLPEPVSVVEEQVEITQRLRNLPPNLASAILADADVDWEEIKIALDNYVDGN